MDPPSRLSHWKYGIAVAASEARGVTRGGGGRCTPSTVTSIVCPTPGRVTGRPLVVPGVATTILYAFLFSWTEFVGALTFLTSNDLYTLPLALLNMESGSVGQVNFGFLEAGAVIAMIPCLVLYVALQRYYVRGLTSGVVKG